MGLPSGALKFEESYMVFSFENIILYLKAKLRVEGPLRLDEKLFRLFLSLPLDPLPEFRGSAPGVTGRGKDHPRYGRFMHAFVKFYKPELVVEVGTNAGGSAVGIARALNENGSGNLICVNIEGIPDIFPATARMNIKAAGLDEKRFELICGDSRKVVPDLARRFPGKAGVYLVDGGHTFDNALSDIINGLPMMKRGGFILVHDIDKGFDMGAEKSIGHPYPVYEAFRKVADDFGFKWCILKFIRKHLGVIQVAA